MSTLGVDQQEIGGHSADPDGFGDGIGTDPAGRQRAPARGVLNGNGASPSAKVLLTRDPQLLGSSRAALSRRTQTSPWPGSVQAWSMLQDSRLSTHASRRAISLVRVSACSAAPARLIVSSGSTLR